MSRHDDRVYLAHMRDFARTALEITHGKDRAHLDTEAVLRYALLHLLCVLGEAANKVSQDGRTANPEIPWGGIIGTRNRLIHGYDVVELDRLWETVETDLPPLLQTLSAILDD